LTPLYLLGWGGLPQFDPDPIFSPLFSSEGGIATWWSPETDKQLADARYEFDLPRRKAMYQKISSEIGDAAPWIFLFQFEDLYGASRRLVWQPRADETIFGREMSLKE
jgi:peptide/nickel transport system substrate-binding protein